MTSKAKQYPREVSAKAIALEDIFNANDLAMRAVDVPEWGGTLYVREMSGEQLAFFAQNAEVNDSGDMLTNSVEFMSRCIVMVMCDEKGNLTGRQPGDEDFEATAAKLRVKSSKPLTRVFMEALKASGLTGKSLEDIEGK